MGKRIDSKKINSRRFGVSESRMTHYLRLDSCRQLMGGGGWIGSEIRNYRIILISLALLIFIIGVIFVLF